MSTSTAATAGWRFNQIGIRVADLARTMTFYRDVFGMREVARINCDTLQIVFLAYPLGDKDPKEEEEGRGALLDREGVLEVICSQDSQTHITNPSQHPSFGLVKLCFTVPDLPACMARMKAHGVKVLKEPGSRDGLELARRATGAEEIEKGRNKGLWDAVTAVAFIQDPDGYLIEVIQY